MILDLSSESSNKSLKILSDVAHLSSLNVNFDKTKIVWIGKIFSKQYTSRDFDAKSSSIVKSPDRKMIVIS
jgi:hypothetical protein